MNHLVFRNKASARKGEYTCKTHVELLNGGYCAAVIKLDPGCSCFGKTVDLCKKLGHERAWYRFKALLERLQRSLVE